MNRLTRLNSWGREGEKLNEQGFREKGEKNIMKGGGCILVLLLPGCVTLGKLLNFSVLEL